MSADRGKEWEKLFKDLCEASNIDCVRFYDVMLGFKDVDNPADFVISRSKKDPSLLIECKATGFDRWDLRFRQYESLKSLKNFNSYVVIWFHKRKKIWALNIDLIEEMRESGIKSINCMKLSEKEGAFQILAKWKTIKPYELDLSVLWRENETNK